MKKTNGRRRTGPHNATLSEPTRRSNTGKEQNNHGKQPPHKHGMMHKQIWCMSGLMRHGMAKCNKQYYQLSGAQYATSCILMKHHDKLFSSFLFMYPTILNVVKHGKRVKQSKTTYLGNLNEAGNNKQQFQKIPICVFWIWYCCALNTILMMSNSKMKCTMLN